MWGVIEGFAACPVSCFAGAVSMSDVLAASSFSINVAPRLRFVVARAALQTLQRGACPGQDLEAGARRSKFHAVLVECQPPSCAVPCIRWSGVSLNFRRVVCQSEAPKADSTSVTRLAAKQYQPSDYSPAAAWNAGPSALPHLPISPHATQLDCVLPHRVSSATMAQRIQYGQYTVPKAEECVNFKVGQVRRSALAGAGNGVC